MATASRVRQWMILEQAGPWGREALLESRLDPVIARTLRAHAHRHHTRVVLCRRPTWQPDARAATHRVHLAHTSVEGAWVEQLDCDDASLLRLDLTALARPEPPGLGDPGPSDLFFVCTNGRHDACCADFGRPVVRALAAAGFTDVWECSHIGGDRFAANVVHLPSGTYLGRVPPDQAATMLTDLAHGLLAVEHYRGRCIHPNTVQAAEILARRELAERRLTALVLVDVTASGKDEATTRFRYGESMVEVVVRRRRGPSVPLTCTENRGHTWLYDLDALRVTT
jgi:hypothetical protein